MQSSSGDCKIFVLDHYASSYFAGGTANITQLIIRTGFINFERGYGKDKCLTKLTVAFAFTRSKLISSVLYSHL